MGDGASEAIELDLARSAEEREARGDQAPAPGGGV